MRDDSVAPDTKQKTFPFEKDLLHGFGTSLGHCCGAQEEADTSYFQTFERHLLLIETRRQRGNIGRVGWNAETLQRPCKTAR